MSDYYWHEEMKPKLRPAVQWLPVDNRTRWNTDDIHDILGAAMAKWDRGRTHAPFNREIPWGRLALIENVKIEYFSGSKSETNWGDHYLVKLTRNGDEECASNRKVVRILKPSVNWAKHGLPIWEAMAVASESKAPTALVCQLLLRFREMGYTHRLPIHQSHNYVAKRARFANYDRESLDQARDVVDFFNLKLRFRAREPSAELIGVRQEERNLRYELHRLSYREGVANTAKRTDEREIERMERSIKQATERIALLTKRVAGAEIERAKYQTEQTECLPAICAVTAVRRELE